MTDLVVAPTASGSADDVGSAVAELDRQVQRGSFFAQAVFQRTTLRLSSVEAILTRLIDVLADQGVLQPHDLGVTITGPRDDAGPDSEQPEPADSEDPPPAGISWPAVAIRVDDPDEPVRPGVAVNCEERMHICQAVCCKLSFPLSAPEIETSAVKWDIGHPYVIRQDSTGYCTHNDTATRRCQVYDQRPGICRRYSCAGDTRIWKDFDNMVLNQEWLDEHLATRDIHLEGVMPSMEVPVRLTAKPTADGGGRVPA